MDKSYKFISPHPSLLSFKLLNFGITNYKDTLTFIQNLPYGRNSNRSDYSLVLKELKGTCSTKHAFLSELANQQNIPNIKLFVGIYNMCEENTPGIKAVLEKWQLPYLPEAHCYLKINNEIVDITRISNHTISFENSLVFEKEIFPNQIGEYKVKLHQTYLKHWIVNHSIKYDFITLWKIRELCIQKLSEKQV